MKKFSFVFFTIACINSLIVGQQAKSTPTPEAVPTPSSRPKIVGVSKDAGLTQNVNTPIAPSGSSLLPEVCEVQLDDLPAVRSLKIGVSRASVSLILPKCGNDLSYTCFYRVESLTGTINRNNLDAIAVNFNESDSVSSFSIIYDDSIKWKSTREFALSLSDSLGLNPARWQYSLNNKKPNPSSEIYFSCTNYYAKVAFVDEVRPQLTLSKTKALIAAEEERDQQRRKKIFKP